MILHAHWQGRDSGAGPVLVWLHGLLGDAEEWRQVQSLMGKRPQLSINLPGHGGSQAQLTTGFGELSSALSNTLQYHRIQRYWLIGYSLGGRLAIYHACRHAGAGLAGVVVEGSHPGLDCPEQRALRLEQDSRWARRFCEQPLLQTLEAWYQQPVFASLTTHQRAALIQRRLHNHPAAVAAMLLATSLAKQPYLVPELHQLTVPFHYFCGEQDRKFQQLAARASLPCELIPGAGHNAHRANPSAFAHQLAQRLTSEESR
ncbi:2-succinyl-6-hydroxy-2,4-cyclohexadiene-1-carboxylate synthase [Erwinia pyri]|uniref:2-succinyl-6-hydroxy-2,4-cyclohexadiene-1-carboxylate synthase n=1 Tax=Erwinia pyri TaxID=3062598 RepID=A0AA50HPE5_9GAMM|nr:2-succinyl-6-hydroxy-2,4-cyclohexadiene-1-carboxylate synthase [Erwinia sp. DE2]WLS80182.1 2-succinyl-6-hydroxy-2,4-cyclohexadiene-1-carboxylate synthase [Erwinia sp. DE2]